ADIRELLAGLDAVAGIALDRFWKDRLPASREGTRWDEVLFVLVAYRLLSPGSEWRLHREWFDRSALADLLGSDASLGEINTLYRCHDRLLAHKQAVFDHLTGRWRDLFNASFEVLLYDLTSTYFEADPPFPEGDKRRHGYSRDHRPDCVQVVIALIITPDGLPLAYEVLPGNTSDKTTLKGFLERIEAQYGKAERVWLMDRGVPTEEILSQMRTADPPVRYLVGTPKGRLSKLEKELLDKPWWQARLGVQVKLLPKDGELYVFAESRDRLAKERSMRRRQQGRYLLRTNLADDDPARLWSYYLQLVRIEEAFRNLKGDLAVRPIFHQLEGRVEAHIFIAFLAYCLHVTLARRLGAFAPGLTPRSVLEKFSAVQMIDVHIPTTDGREIQLTRHTEPQAELRLLLDKLKLELPPQPSPRITSLQAASATPL